VNPDLRAKLLALAEEMDDSPYESASAFGWQLKELIEEGWPEPKEPTHETHICAWERVALDQHRCVKRWSDGSRCNAVRADIPHHPQTAQHVRA